MNVPIYLSSTYAQEEIGRNRTTTTRARVTRRERRSKSASASLEGGTTAHVFGSGMAAIAALVTMLKSGDHVICGANVYGGTPRLFNQVFAHYGIEFSYVDTSDAEGLKAAMRPRRSWCISKRRPIRLMTLTDIAAVAGICHSHGIE